MLGAVGNFSRDSMEKLVDIAIPGLDDQRHLIEGVDLGFLSESLHGMAANNVDGCFWDITDVPEMTAQYRRWLLLSWAGERLGFCAVTDKVRDAAWHACMERPVYYHSLCMGVYGHLVDHRPNYVHTKADRDLIQMAMDPTEMLELVLFGDVTSRRPDRCGQPCLDPTSSFVGLEETLERLRPLTSQN